MKLTTLLLSVAAALAAPSICSAESIEIRSEAEFLKQFGDQVHLVEPGVYQVTRRNNARVTTISFGSAGRVHDIKMLRQQLADALARKETSAEAIRHVSGLQKIIERLQAANVAKQEGTVCDGAYTINASTQLSYYPSAQADGTVSVFGPPAPPGIAGYPYEICVTAWVHYGSSTFYGTPEYGCYNPAGIYGTYYESDTGNHGPTFCASASAFSSISGACYAGGTTNYASVSDSDNNCG